MSAIAHLRSGVLLVLLPGFALGFLAALGIRHADTLVALTADAYQARFRAMTSTPSTPLRYYAVHDRDLQLAAIAPPGVAAVTATSLGGLSAIEIVPGGQEAIDRLRQVPGVYYVLAGNLPLVCH